MKPARLELHADLTQRTVVNSAALAWHASPCALIERRTMERDGDELAWDTSIVRYAPGARFDAYVRLSQHQPFSREGCLILVKTGHLLPATP